jgi:hypothetical protein
MWDRLVKGGSVPTSAEVAKVASRGNSSPSLAPNSLELATSPQCRRSRMTRSSYVYVLYSLCMCANFSR